VRKPYFVVPLADLERGPKRVSWELSASFLRWALEGSNALAVGDAGELRVELMLNGRDVLVRGEAELKVTMPCARTLEPLEIDVRPEIFLMLSPAAEPASRKPRAARAKTRGTEEEPARRRKKKRGPGWAETPLLTDTEAAKDTYRGEEVVLDEFVREFILLDLPMVATKIGLPLEPEPAIGGPSEARADEAAIDPRLLPLVEIARRMRQQ
jgi:uncharacterized metal-binding protein YceD (DUF177 family)